MDKVEKISRMGGRILGLLMILCFIIAMDISVIPTLPLIDTSITTGKLVIAVFIALNITATGFIISIFLSQFKENKVNRAHNE